MDFFRDRKLGSSVQRSASLKVDSLTRRRPASDDRNNNTGSGKFGDFQLADMLARATSFNDKFLRIPTKAENEAYQSVRRYSDGENGVQLPRRYLPLQRRRMYKVPRLSISGLGSYAGSLAEFDSESTSPSGLDSVPETPYQDLSAENSWDERKEEMDTALAWLRQEICTLKRKDRSLMRTYLDLGAEIHQMTGLSGCSQSFSTNLNPFRRSSVSQTLSNLSEDAFSTSNDGMDQSMLDDSSRTVSMVSVMPVKPAVPPKKKFLSFLRTASSVDEV